MTDAELDAMETRAHSPIRFADTPGIRGDVLALVAEVRRYKATFGVYEKRSPLRDWLGHSTTLESAPEPKQ